MWIIWLLIAFVFGLVAGTIYSVSLKKKLTEAQAELAELRERFL